MALTQCPECDKQISDKATSCPHCGAPASPASMPSSAAPKPPKKKTPPATWVVVAFLAVLLFWYMPKTQREANLPQMPVEVKTRSALLGPGLVLLVKNTSTRHLTFVVTLKNPTTNQEKAYRLDAAPSGTVEVGHKEGWAVASGDLLKIVNNDYKNWEGSVP
jgi:hypothetical protein